MSGVLDFVGDLAHHAVDAVTGAIAKASSPDKAPASAKDASQHLGGMVGNGASAISGRQKQIDDQVAAAGG